MNSAVEKIREATCGTRYEEQLYLVGGIVRDKVMGRPLRQAQGRPPTEDVDIVLEGDALELARFLHGKGIADHKPVTYPRFGTAMVTIGGHAVELVSARKESYAPTSRKPQVEHAGLYEDVMRRDFTINTLLENLHTGETLDLTGRAMEDIRAGIIRTPTEPATTFYDDPLRMLRAIRFAVRLGFEIEKATYEAIVRDAARLAIISKERIRDEFAKILLSDKPARGLRMLNDAGLLAQFAPELVEMQGVEQGGGHFYDVWEHVLHSLESLPPQADLTLRLAVLLHDTGKPKTKTQDSGGKIHFYGHEDLSAQIARKILRRLRFPVSEAVRVARLISMHMRIGEYRREWRDAAVKRLMRDAAGDIPDLLALAMADIKGYGPNASTENLEKLEKRMERILLKVPVEELESPLDGREIMDLLEIPSSPKVKEVKEYLCEEVIEGRLAPGDKESARKLVLEKFGLQ
jgi:poly(A) polymerase